jgi:hypothetical protein
MEPRQPNESTVRSFKLRKTLQIALGVPAAAAFALALFQYKGLIDVQSLGLPETPFYVGCFLGCALYLLMTFLNWRCPECRAYLGKQFRLPSCPHCGTPFTR